MEIVLYITGTEIVAGSSPVGNTKTFIIFNIFSYKFFTVIPILT